MSNLTDLKQGIEAVSQNLRELDDKHSESDEYMLGLTQEAEDRVRQSQAELMRNQTEYEQIMGEYEQARRFLHTIELLNLKSSGRSYLTGVSRNLDANTMVVAPGRAANWEVTDPGAVPDEDYADVDPDNVRLGVQRILKKKGNGVPRGAEAEELAT